MASTLRPYQTESLDAVRDAFRRGRQSVVLVAPTGAGKTTMAAHIVKGAAVKGKDVIFLAHRKELIEQPSTRFDDEGMAHGIIKAGNPRENDEAIQIASKDTLIRRLDRIQGGDSCLVVIDECHRSISPSYTKIVDECRAKYAKVLLIGLTATPFRTDGRGLGELYEEIVSRVTMEDLIDEGFLVPPRCFTTPNLPDLSNVPTRMGDYAAAEMAQAFDQKALIGDVVSNWRRVAGDRLTVVYAASVAHSKRLAQAFVDAGVSACHIDGNTEEEARGALLDAFSGGKYQVVCNCGVLTEGWDCPQVGCVVLARATMSRNLYIQMAGRGARSYNGKKDYILLDHGSNALRHGLPHDPVEFTLEGLARKAKGDKTDSLSGLTTCPSCYALYPTADGKCPCCGAVKQVKRQTVKEVQAELEEMSESKRVKRQKEIYEELLAIAKKEGRGTNWAAGKYHEITGKWPRFRDLGPKREWRKSWNPTTKTFEFKLTAAHQ